MFAAGQFRSRSIALTKAGWAMPRMTACLNPTIPCRFGHVFALDFVGFNILILSKKQPERNPQAGAGSRLIRPCGAITIAMSPSQESVSASRTTQLLYV